MDAIGGHTLEKVRSLCLVVTTPFLPTTSCILLTKSSLQKWASQVPMRRHGTPEDVANLVSFLAKEETSYITGKVPSDRCLTAR